MCELFRELGYAIGEGTVGELDELVRIWWERF
jgi:hypothetical protein